MRLWSLPLLLTLACTPPSAPPTPTTLTVRDGFIRDPEGRALILRGANVSGRHKEPPYFDFQGAPEFEHLRRDWGMNGVRFLVSWAALEPTRDAYDEAYLDEVVRRVKLATDAGLSVFLDLHQDLYGVGFLGGNGMPRWTCDEANYASYVPKDPWFFNYLSREVTACWDGFWTSRDLQQKYVDAWSHLAARFVNEPRVIGFDPMNEPYWGSIPPDVLEATRLANLYRAVIAAVRVHRPDWLAFIEPASSRNLGLPSHLPPFTEGNLVYAPHSYDGDAEQGRGFNPARREVLIDQLTRLRAEADGLGAALVLGEYGGMADRPHITDYMDAEFAAAGLARAGAMYWDYTRNAGYGLVDENGVDKPQLLTAVARPFPERVAGTPGAWTFENETLTFTFTPDPAVKAPTLIALPAGTWSASCEDCTATVKDGVVEVSAVGAAPRVSVTR